jgi:hypothetical protein
MLFLELWIIVPTVDLVLIQHHHCVNIGLLHPIPVFLAVHVLLLSREDAPTASENAACDGTWCDNKA